MLPLKNESIESSITIHYPAYLALSLKWSDQEFIAEMKKISIFKLYEIGKISSSIGAKVLGINRIAFLEALGTYQISPFSIIEESELIQDLNNA